MKQVIYTILENEPLTADVQLVALGSYDMLEKIRN